MVYLLEKRIDAGNAAETEEKLLTAYRENGPLVLDAKELEYISSAGLRVLLKVRKMQDTLRIDNVSEEIYEILEITGFDSLMEIHKA